MNLKAKVAVVVAALALVACTVEPEPTLQPTLSPTISLPSVSYKERDVCDKWMREARVRLAFIDRQQGNWKSLMLNEALNEGGHLSWALRYVLIDEEPTDRECCRQFSSGGLSELVCDLREGS